MNIGSLYRVKEFYWLLFSSKESASDELHDAMDGPTATYLAAFYSKEYKENVTYLSSDSYIVLLEEDGELKRFLTSDGLIGWTSTYRFDEDYNDCFEEVKQP